MLDFRDFTRPFGARTSNEYAQAALPAFANVAGSAFNWDATNNQTAAQERIANNRLASDAQANLTAGYGDIGRSLAGLYGGYGTNLTNLLSNQMGAYGQAETARQIGLANAATAAMSGLGQASAGAMGAWGANQAAWAKAMADSQMANQQAMSQYGASRNSALSSLGGSAASLGGSLGNSYAALGGQLAGARSALGSSLGQSYGGLLGGLGNSAASLAGTLGVAGSNLYGTLGTAAGGVAGTAANALGGMYGTFGSAAGNLGGALGTAQAGLAGQAANATGQYGGSSNTARGAMMSSLGNVDLGAYQSALNYARDMGKLGLARELGTGQLGVASQIAGGFSPGNTSGGAQLRAGGSPLAFSSGQYGGGPGGGAMGGAPGGGAFAPYSQREWYQDPQYAASFDSRMPYGDLAMSRLDAMALGGISDAARFGAGQADAAGRQSLQTMQSLAGRGGQQIVGAADRGYDSLRAQGAGGQRIISDAGQLGFNQLSRLGSDADAGFRSLAGMTNAGIDSDAMAAYAGIGSAGMVGMDELRNARRSVESSGILDALRSNARSSRRDLNNAYYSSQDMPSQMLGQTVAGFRGMMDSHTGSMNSGMNQFYDHMMAPVAIGRNDLATGVRAGSGLLTGLADRMQDASLAARQAQIAAQGAASLRRGGGGGSDMISRLFPTPAEQERQRQQVAQMQRADRDQQVARLQAERDSIVNGPQTGPYHPMYSERVRAINFALHNLSRQT